MVFVLFYLLFFLNEQWRAGTNIPPVCVLTLLRNPTQTVLGVPRFALIRVDSQSLSYTVGPTLGAN